MLLLSVIKVKNFANLQEQAAVAEAWTNCALLIYLFILRRWDLGSSQNDENEGSAVSVAFMSNTLHVSGEISRIVFFFL